MLHKNAAFKINSLGNHDGLSNLSFENTICGMDALFILYLSGILPSWMAYIINNMYSVSSAHGCYYQCTLWIPKLFYPSSIAPHCLDLLEKLHADWTYSIHEYNTAVLGDIIDALRVGITIYWHFEMYHGIGDSYHIPLDMSLEHGFKHCICSDLNQTDDLI